MELLLKDKRFTCWLHANGCIAHGLLFQFIFA